jgi:hypothetical protein
MPPPAVTSQASITAQWTGPKDPYRTACCTLERCISRYGTWRELISARSVLSFCQGARKLIALADASAPSSDSPVEAPVSTRIWYDRPAACSVFARSAMARGMAFAEPALRC